MIPALAAVRCERRVRKFRPARLAPVPLVPVGISVLRSMVAASSPEGEIRLRSGAARGRGVGPAFSV